LFKCLDPVDLQGDVENLTLHATSMQGPVTQYPEVGTRNMTLISLVPSTTYTIQLTVTVFGGGSVSSEPVAATTLDGCELETL
jgi:hypothetical protein